MSSFQSDPYMAKTGVAENVRYLKRQTKRPPKRQPADFQSEIAISEFKPSSSRANEVLQIGLLRSCGGKKLDNLAWPSEDIRHFSSKRRLNTEALARERASRLDQISLY